MEPQPPSFLQELHTYLLRIRSVSEELEEGPRRVKRLQTRLAGTEKKLADHLAEIKKVKVGINEREVSLKANSEKIKKHKRDLEGIISKKEFDALNIEVASLEKRNSDLEDEGLQMMTQVEEMTARIPEFEQAIAVARDELKKETAEQEAQRPSWQARLDEAKKLAAEKIVEIPEDWQKAFKRMEQSEGADSLASLNGKSCSACYTDITAQQYTQIISGRVEACKNCGRLLYVTA